MTQAANQQTPTSSSKKKYITIWIVILVVVVVIVAGIGIALTYHHATKSPPLSVSPDTTGIAAQAGTNITFYSGVPNGTTFTRMVWNFGNGITKTITSGNGEVSYAYPVPGSYLVSLTAYNKTSQVSSNSSLLAITITPSLSSNPASIFGPISMTASSTGNQTIGVGGYVNLTYGGLLAASPVTVGSSVPGAVNYTVQSFVWNVDNGNQTFNDNNTGMPETVNLTFPAPGIHTVELEAVTSSGVTEVNGSYMITVAVGNYSISKIVPSIKVNRQQIVNAEFDTGGPVTLDPALAYDLQSYEVLYELYQPLIYYNGTSTSVFNPVIATEVPTVANGEISPNYLNYTFYINTTLQFSNGDHVTPWDVYVSFARSLLFSNDPGAPGWIFAHALIPGASIYGPFNNSFYWIHHAITWSNSTESVTFHLLPSSPTWLPNTSASYGGQDYGVLNQSYKVQNYGASSYFLQLISGPTAAFILDYNWLVQHDAAPSNNSISYAKYANTLSGPGVYGSRNLYLQSNTMGTGPYVISLYEAAQQIILHVNPNYHATSGMPSKSALIPSVIISYLTNQVTAQDEMKSGYAQFATDAFPVESTPLALQLIHEKILSSQTVSEMLTGFYAFNLDINVTGAKGFDSGFNLPAGFFANLSVRKAFGYAFNYSYYINQLNANSGVTFADQISGVIPPGVQYYPSNISTEAPLVYNLTMAKYYWSQTSYAQSNTVYSLPVFAVTFETPQVAMYTEWGKAMNEITNGKITFFPVQISYTQMSAYLTTPGNNPMPIDYLEWGLDYPNPTDFTAPLLQSYGIYSYPDGIFPTSVFNPSSYPSQWANISKMWGYLNDSQVATNPTNITLDYFIAEKIAINLFFYVGTTQPVGPFYYSAFLSANSVLPTGNPVIGGLFVLYYPLHYS